MTTSHPDHKAILHQRQLAASRQRGQNFLVHRRTAELIVELAGVTAEDRVIELGVGFGALSLPLAERAASVIGLEIDSGIVAWHREEQDLPANFDLRHEDLLKADFPKLAEETGGRLKIVANLPYSISNPLLFKLLENREIMESAVLMLQKEVAQRLTASPATKEYGILTVLLNGCAKMEKLMDVGPGQFHPRPKVDSVVVKITFFPIPERAAKIPPHDHELLKKLVKASFQQRRKTLLNSLSASGLPGIAKELLPALLNQVGIDPQVRPERLTVEDFVRIANLMDKVD